MRLSRILVLAIYLSSCKQATPEVAMFKTKDFIIIDTTVQANKFLQSSNYSGDYPIYYIGGMLDTIRIGKRYWRGRTRWANDFKDPYSSKYSEKTLSIFVDTSIKTNSPVEYLSDNPVVARDSTINYNSFLFTIKNISGCAINLGRTFSLFFISREAKDKNGNWVKMDKSLREWGICGTGEPTIILKPNELVISKAKRYKGTYSSEFRLVFGEGDNVVYSNVFRDYIDERSLKKYKLAKIRN